MTLSHGRYRPISRWLESESLIVLHGLYSFRRRIVALRNDYCLRRLLPPDVRRLPLLLHPNAAARILETVVLREVPPRPTCLRANPPLLQGCPIPPLHPHADTPHSAAGAEGCCRDLVPPSPVRHSLAALTRLAVPEQTRPATGGSASHRASVRRDQLPVLRHRARPRPARVALPAVRDGAGGGDGEVRALSIHCCPSSGCANEWPGMVSLAYARAAAIADCGSVAEAVVGVARGCCDISSQPLHRSL